MQKNLVSRSIAAVLFAVVASFAQASAVLVGTGTLNTTNDLTVISTGSSTLEFLDLSVTDGMSIAGAVSAYSGYGFRWANEAEVASVFAAFGIAYTSLPGIQTTLVGALTPSLVSTTNFVNYFGITNGIGSSLGWFADDTLGGNSYICISAPISVGDCIVNFVYKDSPFNDPSSSIGVFLVRDSGTSVPEPGTLALVGLSLAWISALRRKA